MSFQTPESYGFAPATPERTTERTTSYTLRLQHSTTPFATYELGVPYIISLAFTPDGNHFLAFHNDMVLVKVNTSQQHILRTPDGCRTTSAAFSPDGGKLVSTHWREGEPGLVFVWDVARRAVSSSLVTSTSNAPCASFSADGERLVTGHVNGHAIVRNTDTLEEETSLVSDSQVNAAHFSSDARRVITTHRDGRARVWNVQTGVAMFTVDDACVDANFVHVRNDSSR